MLFGVGFGPTLQPVPAGVSFFGATPTATPVAITIAGVPADVMFAGITQAGLYQFNLVVPALPDGVLASFRPPSMASRPAPDPWSPFKTKGGWAPTLSLSVRSCPLHFAPE